MKKISGVYVATVTPFTSKGELDVDAYLSHLDYLKNAGIHGLVPCGTTGETPTLSDEERQKVIGLTSEFGKKHQLPVIAGAGGNCTSKVVDLLAEANDLGADAALVVTPYYNKPNARGVLAHYRVLADKSPLPIVLYNVPPRTNVNMLPETVEEILKSDKVVGIKEASGNYSQWVELAHRIDWSQKALLAGDDDCVATMMALGGSGVISASANVVPKLFVQMVKAMENGDFKKAFELQISFQPMKKALFAETNPTPSKFALSVREQMQNKVRLPLVEVSSETEALVRAALKIEGMQ